MIRCSVALRPWLPLFKREPSAGFRCVFFILFSPLHFNFSGGLQIYEDELFPPVKTVSTADSEKGMICAR